MKNKRFLFGLLIFTMMFVLNGCSLAKEYASEEKLEKEELQDCLIGVIVTEEHLDLFDMDAFLEENINQIADGEELHVKGDSSYYGRIYATMDKHESDEPLNWEFVFEGVKGYQFFAPTLQGNAGEPFHTLIGNDEICDVNTHYITKDEGQEVHLEGTLYLESGVQNKNKVYYMNPVYQTEEGDIYVTTGNGISSEVGGEEGSEMSSSLDAAATTTVNGERESYACSVKVNFVTAKAATKFLVYHMDKTHKILKVEEYVPGEMPEELKAEEGSSYLLLEQVKGDAVTREIYEPKEEETTIETLYPTGAGVMGMQFTTVTW